MTFEDYMIEYLRSKSLPMDKTELIALYTRFLDTSFKKLRKSNKKVIEGYYGKDPDMIYFMTSYIDLLNSVCRLHKYEILEQAKKTFLANIKTLNDSWDFYQFGRGAYMFHQLLIHLNQINSYVHRERIMLYICNTLGYFRESDFIEIALKTARSLVDLKISERSSVYSDIQIVCLDN